MRFGVAGLVLMLTGVSPESIGGRIDPVQVR
jgi:hypothetical protein